MNLQSRRWGERKTLMFVKLFLSHKCLWDNRDTDYKEESKRIEAIEDLIKKFYAWSNILIDEEIIARKVRCLRSTYSQELAKIRKRRAQGAHYQTSLKWFKVWHRCLPGRTANEIQHLSLSNEDAHELEELNYELDETSSRDLSESGGTDLEDSSRELEVTKEEREDNDLLQLKDGSSPTTWLENKTKVQEIITNSDTDPFVTSDSEYLLLVKTEPEEETPFKPKRRKHKTNSPYFNTNFKTIRSKDLRLPRDRFADTDSKHSKEDEFDIFGKYIASQLRNMGLQGVMKAEPKILSIVRQARLNDIKDSKEDEFIIFGKNIASQLRDMGLQRALRAQLKIQSIVSEARLNSLVNK